MRIVCWSPTWSPDHSGIGLEQVTLMPDSADSTLLAFNEDGTPLRITYHLHWNEVGRLLRADLQSRSGTQSGALALRSDGHGNWQDAGGTPLRDLDGCIDIDIWPTPFTNSFPIWRSALEIGERREFLMAWVSGPDLTVEAKPQAYTRLQDYLYLFESLDGSGFKAELPVDEAGLVLDYPELFRRV
jgi:uncharacterized protein